MAGEIIKGTVNANIVAVDGHQSLLVTSPDGNQYFNEIAAYDFENDIATTLSILNAQTTNIPASRPKLAIDQGKQFTTKQITFDANVVAANVDNIINDRINQWISSTGSARYDDFQVIINPSGLGNHDITIVIIRYF